MASNTELKYFIEVAQVLNLSRASERLGISQPSLSLAIKRLENSIGTTLFIRHKKGVNLTQAGKQLLAHAKQLLQYWEEIKTQALASHDAIQGSFRLGCHPSVGLRCLAGFLPDLLIKNPKLEIHLFHDISRKVNEAIINLSVDLGIVVNPFKHPDLIIYQLAKDRVTFWRTADYIPLENTVIICDPDLHQTQILLKEFQKNKTVYPRLLASSNLENIAKLTAAGCGIGILPESVAQSFQLEKIADLAYYNDEICLVYRHENRNIKAIQTLIGAIKDYFKKQVNRP